MTTTHLPWDFGALQDLRDITGGNKTIKTACGRRIAYRHMVSQAPGCEACVTASKEREAMAVILARAEEGNCPACQGSGWTTKGWEERAPGADPFKGDCRQCHGTGSIQCPVCGKNALGTTGECAACYHAAHYHCTKCGACSTEPDMCPTPCTSTPVTEPTS